MIRSPRKGIIDVVNYFHRSAYLTLVALLLTGCATRNPFEGEPDVQRIREVQAIALNATFESHQHPSTGFSDTARPDFVCLGVGQRGAVSNRRWLSQNPRETRWDPDAMIRSRLNAPPSGRIVPLSQCLRDGNDRERHVGSGEPAVTYFVSSPRWTTPNAVSMTVTIRGLGQFDMVYSAQLRRLGGEWNIHRFSCRWNRVQCEHFR